MPDTLTKLCRALNEQRVRYLLVGGHAVGAYGYARATHDIDLVVALDTENARRAIVALEGLGYRPLAPVKARDFCEKEIRAAWLKEKGALVFQMASGDPCDHPVDLFINEPFDFEAEYGAATLIEYEPDVVIPVVSLPTLLAMKKAAGRARDLVDIEELRRAVE